MHNPGPKIIDTEMNNGIKHQRMRAHVLNIGYRPGVEVCGFSSGQILCEVRHTFNAGTMSALRTIINIWFMVFFMTVGLNIPNGDYGEGE